MDWRRSRISSRVGTRLKLDGLGKAGRSGVSMRSSTSRPPAEASPACVGPSKSFADDFDEFWLMVWRRTLSRELVLAPFLGLRMRRNWFMRRCSASPCSMRLIMTGRVTSRSSSRCPSILSMAFALAQPCSVSMCTPVRCGAMLALEPVRKSRTSPTDTWLASVRLAMMRRRRASALALKTRLHSQSLSSIMRFLTWADALRA
mmetsp:Transcript_14709/g.44197  ORF Transcript_14709/g.44197 Transcript_14709/m.44197 type:complete len:203 (-) Transcript_14709:1681-2289(-)